jgi:hypothetical protein
VVTYADMARARREEARLKQEQETKNDNVIRAPKQNMPSELEAFLAGLKVL